MSTAVLYRAAAILDQIKGKLCLQAKQCKQWLARVRVLSH
jgi:hypothetical protein